MEDNNFNDDILFSLPDFYVSTLWKHIFFHLVPSELVEKCFQHVLTHYNEEDKGYSKLPKGIPQDLFDDYLTNVNAALIQYEDITEEYKIKLPYHHELEKENFKKLFKFKSAYDEIKSHITHFFQPLAPTYFLQNQPLPSFSAEKTPEAKPDDIIDPVNIIEINFIKDWFGIFEVTEHIRTGYQHAKKLFDFIRANKNHAIMGFYIDKTTPHKPSPLIVKEIDIGQKPVQLDKIHRRWYRELPANCVWMMIFISGNAFDPQYKNLKKTCQNAIASIENPENMEAFKPEDGVYIVNYVFSFKLRD